MRSSIVASLVAVAALTRTAAAAPVEVKVSKPSGALPAGIRASASLDVAYTFADKNGDNYVLFSSKTVSGDPAKSRDPVHAKYIYVDHWVVPAAGKARLVRTVRDMIEDCNLDLTVAFHDAAFGVTDLDGDGIAEITFGYELGCRSDVSPDDYKLLLLENGDKYILRGHTRIDAHDPQQPTAGGDFDPDPASAKWPKAFLSHARELWKQSADDASMPPGKPGGGGGGGGGGGANPCG